VWRRGWKVLWRHTSGKPGLRTAIPALTSGALSGGREARERSGEWSAVEITETGFFAASAARSASLTCSDINIRPHFELPVTFEQIKPWLMNRDVCDARGGRFLRKSGKCAACFRCCCCSRFYLSRLRFIDDDAYVMTGRADVLSLVMPAGDLFKVIRVWITWTVVNCRQ